MKQATRPNYGDGRVAEDRSTGAGEVDKKIIRGQRTLELSKGSDSIIAVYEGSASYLVSTSAALTQVVH